MTGYGKKDIRVTQVEILYCCISLIVVYMYLFITGNGLTRDSHLPQTAARMDFDGLLKI